MKQEALPAARTVILNVYEPVEFAKPGTVQYRRTVPPGRYAGRVECSLTEKGTIRWLLIEIEGIEVGRPEGTLATYADAGKIDVETEYGEVLDEGRKILRHL